MSKKEKSMFHLKVEYLLFLVLYKVLNILPFSLALKTAEKLTRLLFYIDKKHARRTVNNILYAGVESDPEKARSLALDNFGEYGKLLAEIVNMKKMYTLDKMTLCAPEETLDIISPERNSGSRQVILAVAHYGNWEVAGTGFTQLQQNPMVSLMRPFSNPLIGEKILSNRRGDAHELIDKNAGLRPVLKAINQGKTVTILVDQHATSREGIVVEFFGHPARMHMTPALLHLKTGIPILPEITRRKNNNFEFEYIFGKPIIHKPTGDKEKDIYIITQKIADSLEELIRRDPVQWLWAPRHWLSLERREAKDYANWQRPETE